MTRSQMEYIDYINRYARCTGESTVDIGKKLLTREIGREYGCTEKEMEEVGKLWSLNN